MAAGQQALRCRVRAVIDADDVADRIDVDRVEPAVLAHPVREPLRAGAMRIGQVRDGELPFLGIPRIAVRRQPLGPVPYAVAQDGCEAELVVEPDLGDPMDVRRHSASSKSG